MTVRRRPLTLRRRLLIAVDWVAGSLILWLLKLLRLLPPEPVIRAFGGVARRFGRYLPRNRIVVANLTAAYPQLSSQACDALAAESWEHLGRLGAEYAFLDRIFDFDPDNPGAGRFEVVGAEKFLDIRESGKPAILFSGHLANYELLAVCAGRFQLGMTSLFRPPNNRRIARNLFRARTRMMEGLVPSTTGAAYELGHFLEKGGRVGLLIDQHFARGPMIRFFGRETATNPLLGILARRHECAVYGARCIRLHDERFRLELTGPYDLPRDADGGIDVDGAMQFVTDVLEGWIREHPAQWLWAHRRWRDPSLRLSDRRRGAGGRGASGRSARNSALRISGTGKRGS